MFDIFRWSKYETKHKNTEKPKNKTKKIGNPVAEKYRLFSKDEQEPVAALPPQQPLEAFTELENRKQTNLDSECFQNKRINKFQNDGKFYFDDKNKTKITLNLTAKTPLNQRESSSSSERCANINAGQRGEALNSAITRPIDVQTALEYSEIDEISVANRDGNVHSHSHNQSKNSRNELAERQGHGLIGNKFSLLKNQTRGLENFCKTKNLPITKDEIVVLDTTTKSTAVISREEAHFSNEVKIRKNTKTHEHFESKRQSWLGLHLLKNNKNNAQDQNQNTTNQKKTEGSTLRKIFFLRKSKSIDYDHKSFVEITDRQSNQTESVFSKKPQPLEKRKDSFKEISMARGRNNNRLRNNHLQQQQQQQHHHHHNDNNNVKSPQNHSQQNEEEESVTQPMCHKDDNMTEAQPVSANKDEPADSLSLLNTTHLETIYDPANKSTNSYQITSSNNSNRNVEESLSCAQLSNSEENNISQPEDDDSLPVVKGETNLLAKVLCAEALIQCNADKDQPELNCLQEQRNTFTAIIDRQTSSSPTDVLFLKNTCSANTSEELRPTTKISGTEIDEIEARDSDIATNVLAKETDAQNQSKELTECNRDRCSHTPPVEDDVQTSVMGQTNSKQEATRITRASTPREFRESVVVSDNRTDSQKANLESKITIPTITVVDYSRGGTFEDTSKSAQNVSCEFKIENPEFEDSMHKSAVGDQIEKNSYSNARYQNNDTTHSRLNQVALDDVPEQEESEQEESEQEEEDASEEDDQKQNVHNILSNSFPDSGIGLDSLSSHHLGTPPKMVRPVSSGLLSDQNTNSTNPSKSNATYFSKRASSMPLSPTSSSSHRMPFIRDGYSTDCDEAMIQCDEFDFVSEDNNQADSNTNERLVCIESISLPDVVVESTANLSNGAHQNAVQSLSGSSYSENHININGTTGNTMENVRFVPIHIEGSDKEKKFTPKRYSADDSGINGPHGKPTIEIISEEDDNFCMGFGKNKVSQKDNHMIEKLKCDLVSQESQYNAQLEDAQKKTLSLQTKINEMQTLIDTLEKDLAMKTWNVEKLQAELIAAHKDDEFVRKKLKIIEEEKTNLRHQYCDNEEELKRKYDELEQKYKELEEKYKTTQQLASNLQTQLAGAQSDAEECREQMDEMREEMEEHMRLLKNALENSEAERKIGQDKWQKEFEMLRTHNQDREESLMIDCEWQLRQMQKQCKDKIDRADYNRREAVERAEVLECAAQERLKEMHRLRLFEAEAKSLRGLTSEQEESISALTDQIESLKADLQLANENLEDQIEAVRKIKYQCDNKIYDKERELIQRIDCVRNEAASFWENKLYTEMTRLKSELESVFIDERREALDKLQAEHIEELRALTTRYTANEEELREELAELQEKLDQKSTEFLELREKTDNALLQTRMHLDRADRDYQNAMSREEEKREALQESLQKEFLEEKMEMEEKFRERIGQVKDEFSRELQTSTQEMKELHKKELAQQKARLQAERDEAVQELIDRHRKKMAAAEDQIKNIELQHQHDLKDLKAAYDSEKTSLDKRDISNANEIEQLHRKCRCLTNLFEEMRVRYERRDPRPEDLREISELRSRCESHERDLYLLTDRLREMQMQMEELQQRGDNTSNSTKKINGKAVKKPPPKTIPTNCDVIYEENEERDSPPPTEFHAQNSNEDEEDEEEEDEEDDEEENDSENEYEDDVTTQVTKPKMNGHENNKSCSDLINEDDGHMITAV